MKKLGISFYERDNVVQIAQELPGKFLMTKIDGIITGGMITEVEAYEGVTDRASHAFNNRRTARTEVMYCAGGTAYVYLCYGIHHLFNVVTNRSGIPHAILIRAIEPTVGIGTMMKRRKKRLLDFTLTSGPGALSEALGIQTQHTGKSLLTGNIWLEDRGKEITQAMITKTTRIGVDYAGTDALLPYRFYIKENKWISRKLKS